MSLGLKRVSGKGDRILVVGCGGPSGWVNWRVMKRSKANKNLPNNPKDDMGNGCSSVIFCIIQCFTISWFPDSKKFEEYLEDTCKALPPNSCLVMDNASYHSKLVSSHFNFVPLCFLGVPTTSWILLADSQTLSFSTLIVH